MLWCDLKATAAAKKKSLVSEKRGKKFYKACERRFESRDKNHPQKSIVKIFFLLLLAISTRRVLNLCNRRALFNGISTINFIYCHMLMISPFERYWQCWFSKALNIRLICVWKRLFYHSSPSILRKLFDIPQAHEFSILFSLCGHFQLTLSLFLGACWRWRDEEMKTAAVFA